MDGPLGLPHLLGSTGLSGLPGSVALLIPLNPLGLPGSVGAFGRLALLGLARPLDPLALLGLTGSGGSFRFLPFPLFAEGGLVFSGRVR
ncbi:hypothetical protein [Streptomyces sp. NPDC002250]|uniref:hypothetical protein n=1 Tax=Streptomyces sp. NPDC002250 TaxID=3364641 RepID=UPI003681D794